MQPLLQSSSLYRKLTLPQSSRNPELSFVRREMEATRHDADHREGRSIQMDDVAEHIRIGAESTAPQTVAEECGPNCPILIFCFGECSAQLRVHGENIKERRGRVDDVDMPRIFQTGQR